METNVSMHFVDASSLGLQRGVLLAERCKVFLVTHLVWRSADLFFWACYLVCLLHKRSNTGTQKKSNLKPLQRKIMYLPTCLPRDIVYLHLSAMDTNSNKEKKRRETSESEPSRFGLFRKRNGKNRKEDNCQVQQRHDEQSKSTKGNTR